MVDPNPARGMPLQLQRYWLAGKGAAKIRWGMPHDFNRCVRQLRKHFPKNPEGLCNILHQKALGAPPGKGHPGEAAALTAAAELMARQPELGTHLWAGPLAPIGKDTEEARIVRRFDPGALRHRALPLPLDFRERQGPGHTGAVTVGRILGIAYGPDHMGNEYAYGWGDYLDEEIIPEARKARYLMDQGVIGTSIDPGGRIVATVNPEDGAQFISEYTIGGATMVTIPAFSAMRLFSLNEEGDWPDDDDDMYMDLMEEGEEGECGCGEGPAKMGALPMPHLVPGYFAVNPDGWRGLPLAMRESVFDNDDAVKRIQAWASGEGGTVDPEKLKRAFLWHDPRQPETVTQSYRLPVGDVINGRLTMIYHAIYAAAALLSGAHGGLPDIPDEEKNQIRDVISNIYEVMAEEFNDSSLQAPWSTPGTEQARVDGWNPPVGSALSAAGQSPPTITSVQNVDRHGAPSVTRTGEGRPAPMVTAPPVAAPITPCGPNAQGSVTSYADATESGIKTTLKPLEPNGEGIASRPNMGLRPKGLASSLRSNEGSAPSVDIKSLATSISTSTTTTTQVVSGDCSAVNATWASASSETAEDSYARRWSTSKEGQMAKKEPYGDVEYADPGYQKDGTKRYPIDTPDHIRAAWSYINQADNAAKYDAGQLEKVKNRIKAAAKKAGIQIAEAMTASSEGQFPIAPPKGWFSDPKLTENTPLTVTDDGRVFGHLAEWNSCHRDFNECVLAPKSQLEYRPFHLGQVKTAEGETLRAGKIVMDTRHADIRLGYAATAIHYDDTGDEIAVVRAGEDEFGVWVAGAIVPEATPKQVAKLRRSPLSGDWRKVEGNLELVAALAVNVPAFPVYAMEGGDRFSLVAAGTVMPRVDDDVTSQASAQLAAIIASVKERNVDNDHQELLARLADITEDEEIYEQRERAERFALLAAAESAAAEAGTAPAGAPGGQAPVPPVPANGASPAPVAGGAAPAKPTGDQLLTMPEDQQISAMNAMGRFSIVAEPEGDANPPAEETAPAAPAPAPAPVAPVAPAPAPVAPPAA